MSVRECYQGVNVLTQFHLEIVTPAMRTTTVWILKYDIIVFRSGIIHYVTSDEIIFIHSCFNDCLLALSACFAVGAVVLRNLADRRRRSTYCDIICYQSDLGIRFQILPSFHS